MKKAYIIPASTIVELEITQHVLTSSVDVNATGGSVKNGGTYSGDGSDIFGRESSGDFDD